MFMSGGSRGIGLAIAKRAARSLGGRVSVHSKGGVTRTVIELPAKGTGSGSAGGEPGGGGGSCGPEEPGDLPRAA